MDYDKVDDYYHAKNNDGWKISLNYVGNNIMSIDITAPEDLEITVTEAEVTEETISYNEKEPAKHNEKETTKKPDNNTDSLGSDFLEAMDSYEEYMNEYVDFMKKYAENPTDVKLLANYASVMNDYATACEDFEKWNEDDMNAAETAYYIEVQTRVNEKLLELAE